MKRISALILSAALLAACSSEEKEPVDYVNPNAGNISILLVPTYPTTHLPNSMLRVFPMRDDYTGNTLAGLPVMSTKHRAKSSLRISPCSGPDASAAIHPAFSYDRERVTPYSYEVYLDEQDIQVHFAPSHQSAIYSIDYGSDQPAHLVFNGLAMPDSNKVDVLQILKKEGIALYVHYETSVAPEKVDFIENGRGGRNSAIFTFPAGTKNVKVKYGVSYIDSMQAKANLDREIPDYDLDRVAAEGRRIWNETLGKVKVSGKDETAKTLLYTSLYRTYERMICMDEGGRYFSPYDLQVHETGDHKFYNDDWIWDTYRSVHPLRTLLEPSMEEDIINSYVTMASQTPGTFLPTFPECTGDSHLMNCNHGVASILDAYVKGLTDFDLATAYQAGKNAVTQKTLIPWSSAPAGELDQFYKDNGYFPSLARGEKETVKEVDTGWEKRQPVGVTLGTAYDEWCLAQMAKVLGLEEDYKLFLSHSFNYRNLFNPQTGFFHPKDSKGDFIEPFDYGWLDGNGARDYYGENNGWIYRWDVQQNFADLVDLMGGADAFVKGLEDMYSAPLGRSKFVFLGIIPDHTGNVGQFSMGNEPSCHIPYLYNYAGQPWRTQKRVRSLIEQWFRNDLMGQPGDEDGGGMSAFVAFSTLGFYPVTPGLPMYVIGSPYFETAELKLENGNTFKIVCHNYAPENKYIQSAKLNGKDFDQCWIAHKDIVAGGTLEFVMGDTPNKQWAAGSVPPSFEMQE